MRLTQLQKHQLKHIGIQAIRFKLPNKSWQEFCLTTTNLFTSIVKHSYASLNY